MGTFDDFDVEIQSKRDSTPEHFVGSITTAGTPITITPTSVKAIQYAFIMCNGTRDPWNANAINDAIKFSLDGGTTYTTLMSGESQYIPGIYADLIIDASDDGVYYQVIVWS